jgi:hypothetical protein
VAAVNRYEQTRPYDDHVTTCRNLGTGPETPAHLRAAQADLLDTLPGVHLPDLDELRARGTLRVRSTTSPRPRRGLRIAEAEREEWFGEVEGLSTSLAATEDKIAQIEAQQEKKQSPVFLGLPSLSQLTAHTGEANE